MRHYNTSMLHFGPYVTFQPRVRPFWPTVRHFLAHCTSLFGPVAMPTNKYSPTLTPIPCHGPKVILDRKALKKR